MDGENTDWREPPIPERILAEDTEPQMSELATLGNIFIEPGRTFEDLRRKPRFVLAMLITMILTTAFAFTFYYKIGDEGFKRFAAEQLDKNPQAQNMTSDQRESAMSLQMTIMAVVRYALPVLILIGVAIGGLIYWLGGKAFGGSGNYLHGVSTWVYSTFPPAVISVIANMIILAFKSVDEIDIASSQRGLVQANPAMFLDGKSMPVLATLISVVDLFAIWGWILASIGLQKTNKISSASAWAITLILASIGITFRVIGALLSGNPS